MIKDHATAEFGTFRYTHDDFVAFNALTVPQLRAQVLELVEAGQLVATRAQVNRTRKADLVALVAALSPAANNAMIQALNAIGLTGTVPSGVPVATVNALINRELIWDDNDVWYLTSEAHDLDGVSDEARAADMARQARRTKAATDDLLAAAQEIFPWLAEDEAAWHAQRGLDYDVAEDEARWLRQIGLDHDPAEDDANDAAIRAQYAPDTIYPFDMHPPQVEQPTPSVEPTWQLPVTETDVTTANVVVVVQSGTKLVWGKLISVVNRRTRYCPPILATVEINGVRRLIAADDLLAA